MLGPPQFRRMVQQYMDKTRHTRQKDDIIATLYNAMLHPASYSVQDETKLKNWFFALMPNHTQSFPLEHIKRDIVGFINNFIVKKVKNILLRFVDDVRDVIPASGASRLSRMIFMWQAEKRGHVLTHYNVNGVWMEYDSALATSQRLFPERPTRESLNARADRRNIYLEEAKICAFVDLYHWEEHGQDCIGMKASVPDGECTMLP